MVCVVPSQEPISQIALNWKRTLERPRNGGEIILRWLEETGCDIVDWIHAAQDRVLRRPLGNTV
jgi:hypothetical protein